MKRGRMGEAGALICFVALVLAIPEGFWLGRWALGITLALVTVGASIWITADSFDREE